MVQCGYRDCGLGLGDPTAGQIAGRFKCISRCFDRYIVRILQRRSHGITAACDGGGETDLASTVADSTTLDVLEPAREARVARIISGHIAPLPR